VGVVSLFLSSLDVSICTYPLLHVHVLVHVIRGLPLLTECSGRLLTCRSCLKKNLPHTTFYLFIFFALRTSWVFGSKFTRWWFGSPSRWIRAVIWSVRKYSISSYHFWEMNKKMMIWFLHFQASSYTLIFWKREIDRCCIVRDEFLPLDRFLSFSFRKQSSSLLYHEQRGKKQGTKLAHHTMLRHNLLNALTISWHIKISLPRHGLGPRKGINWLISYAGLV
jgi:hypothetical protein